MQVTDLLLGQLKEALWNCNRMDQKTLAKLKTSLTRFGLVENLVVRPLEDGSYEVLSGNQRLQVLRELGMVTAPCVVVELDDSPARLLSQVLNRLQGQDDLGLRAELLRQVLEDLPQEDVLAILPDSGKNLQALASMGQKSMAEHLQAWQQAQQARLHHLTLQLKPEELKLVEAALSQAMIQIKGQREGPNLRGQALTAICQFYLQQGGIV